MLTLERYIVRQVFGPTIVGLVLLLMLFTVFTSIRLMRSAALGNLATVDIMALVFAHDLAALEVLLPSAFFAALVMVMCNWHHSGEAYVAYASGVSPRRVSRPLLLLAVLITMCVAALTIFVRPFAYQMRYDLNERSANLDSRSMQSQHFYAWDEDFVIQAQQVQPQAPNLLDVFAQTRQDGRNVVLRAKAGQINETDKQRLQRIEFFDGVSYELDGENQQDRITEFASLIYVAQRPAGNQTTKRRAQSTATLAGSTNPKEIAEFQWRFSMPLLALFMALIGVELSRLKPQQSPYIRYALTLTVYITVFTTANIVTAAVENGTLPTYPGVFSTVVLLAATYYYIRRDPQFSLARPL